MFVLINIECLKYSKKWKSENFSCINVKMNNFQNFTGIRSPVITSFMQGLLTDERIGCLLMLGLNIHVFTAFSR